MTQKTFSLPRSTSQAAGTSRRPPNSASFARSPFRRSDRAKPLPLLPRKLPANSVCRQLVVSALQNLAGLRTQQDIDNVQGAETFARAFDTGQELLGGDGNVRFLPFALQAVIAHAAGLAGEGFPEIGEKRQASTDLGFSEAHHGVELQLGGPPVVPRLTVDKGLNLIDIGIGIEQQAFSR